MNLFPVEGKFSFEEEKALQALAIKQEMSGLGILRQALRAYQLIVAGTHELREINPDPKLNTAELPNQTYDPRAVEVIRSLDAENAALRAEVERLTQQKQEQCMAFYPVPINRGDHVTVANCILRKDHEGQHCTSCDDKW
jgi:hypothetical protein